MKIARIRRWPVDFGFYNAIYVRIETDDGRVGEAEVAMRRRTRSVIALLDEMAENLVGMDATRIEQIQERLYRDSFLGGTLLTIAISAIDQALWDLNARSLEIPLYRMLGGAFRDEVLLYTHAAASESPAALAELVEKRISSGFRAIKTTLPAFYEKVTSIRHEKAPLVPAHQTETEILSPRIFAYIAEFFAAAREAAGPDVHLMVDCHGRLNVANSIRLAEALAPYNLTFIEEPVPYERPDWLREVSSRSSTPIAAGERWGNHFNSAHFLESHSVAIAQPDVGICGGITVARRIANMAEAHGISIAFHNPFGPLQSAATWQLALTLPNFMISESMITPEQQPYWERYVTDAPVVTNGVWRPTDASGIGPRLNIAELDRSEPRLILDLGGTR
jgi:galactonate dehydratase